MICFHVYSSNQTRKSRFMCISVVSVKRHFKILRLAIKSKLKGFHIFLFLMKIFYKIDSTLELNESRFHFWNYFFETRHKITSALSCNHKSTCFVIFRFYSFNQFLLQGNTSCFEIHSFENIFKYITYIFCWKFET